jgi:hypothetical protein
MRGRVFVAFGVVGAVVIGGLSACSSSSSTGATSGASLGSPCTQDTDCASSTRGQVACFIGGGGDGGGGGEGGGGGGGGGGDGGGGGGGGDGGTKTWCSLKCTPDQAAQLCGAPFDGICNARGYCRLN